MDKAVLTECVDAILLLQSARAVKSEAYPQRMKQGKLFVSSHLRDINRALPHFVGGIDRETRCEQKNIHEPPKISRYEHLSSSC